MLANDNLVPVLRGKLLASINFKPSGATCAPRFCAGFTKSEQGTFIAKLRIFDRTGMTIRISKVLSFFCGRVQLARRNVIAQAIATIVGKPKIVRRWMPGETDGVPDATRIFSNPVPSAFIRVIDA